MTSEHFIVAAPVDVDTAHSHVYVVSKFRLLP
jgi:hypothetical protein